MAFEIKRGRTAQGRFTVKSNRWLTSDVYEMILTGDTGAITAPGQFVNIAIDGLYLRRPISVCDYGENSLTLIYKAVGKGTGIMAAAAAGDCFDMLSGLGNGFRLPDRESFDTSSSILVVGGGVGVPPLYALTLRLIESGFKVNAVLGFNSGCDVFYTDEFKRAGAEVIVTTVDGSLGVKGFVTDGIAALGTSYAYFYACGPEPMLRALVRCAYTEGQLSFESRMACGFGACMCCSCETLYGSKRICRDGPVLLKSEVKM